MNLINLELYSQIPWNSYYPYSHNIALCNIGLLPISNRRNELDTAGNVEAYTKLF